MVNDSSIYVRSGYFDFAEPDFSAIPIENISRSLSRICRFSGFTGEFYSVAQHSFMMSNLVPTRYALEALMHDAHEALVGDLSTPLKNMLPDYRAMENSVAIALRRRWGLPDELSLRVQLADLQMLMWEKRDVLRCDDDWGIDVEVPRFTIMPYEPSKAHELFMSRFYQLTKPE